MVNDVEIKEGYKDYIDTSQVNFVRILFSLCEVPNGEDYYELLCKMELEVDDYYILKKLTSLKIDLGKMPSARMLMEKGLKIKLTDQQLGELLLDQRTLEDEILLFINNLCSKKLSTELHILYNKVQKSKCLLSDDEINKLANISTNLFGIKITEKFEELPNIYKESEDTAQISTGIDELDKMGYFFRKGSTNTILGFTGSYKSMYCTNIAYKAINDGYNVVYISLEVNRNDVYFNFLSRHSSEAKFDFSVEHKKMKSGSLSEVEEKQLFEKVYPDFNDKLKNHLFVIDEGDISSYTYSTFNNILKSIENYFQSKTGKGIDILFVDHIQLLKFSDEDKSAGQYGALNNWMSYFRKNSVNFLNLKKKICVIVACQSNRAGYESACHNNGKYELTAIAEGNEIERSSQLVISIFKDQSYNGNPIAKVQVIKGRDLGVMEEPINVQVQPKYYLFEKGEKYIYKGGNNGDRMIDFGENINDEKNISVSEVLEKKLKNRKNAEMESQLKAFGINILKE